MGTCEVPAWNEAWDPVKGVRCTRGWREGSFWQFVLFYFFNKNWKWKWCCCFCLVESWWWHEMMGKCCLCLLWTILCHVSCSFVCCCFGLVAFLVHTLSLSITILRCTYTFVIENRSLLEISKRFIRLRLDSSSYLCTFLNAFNMIFTPILI